MSDQKENAPGRKPDLVAYHVSPTQGGKGIFHRVGAAWAHKDGQGYQVQLQSVPVDGRITLRELREERMQEYEAEHQARSESARETSTPEHNGESEVAPSSAPER